MVQPVVTKEYREDLGPKDAEGFYEYAYRFWVWWFDLDGRRYRARVYTDEADDADVMYIGGSPAAEYEEDLQTIADYLREDAGVRTISTIGPSGTFEPFITFD